MFLEVAAIVAIFVLGWYLNFRPRSTNQIRPSYTSCRSPSETPTCDYAVIGGGAAGLAAVASILHHTPNNTTILLIEGGTDPQPTSALLLLLSAGRRDRLLSFAPDLVQVPVEAIVRGVQPTFMGLPTADEGYMAQRPWHFSEAEEAVAATAASMATIGTAAAAAAAASGSGTNTSTTALAAAAAVEKAQAKAQRYRLLQYTPFPRGTGIGGTSLLDWGMHLNSLWPKDESAKAPPLWSRLPVHFPAIRNPLSWAFAETVKSAAVAAPHFPTPDAPVQRGTVFPSYLYLDKDGRRLATPAAALADVAPEVLRRRLRVLTAHTVVNFDVEENEVGLRRARGVCVRRSGPAAATQGAFTIAVTKGVVVAAGALHSPRLLRDVAVANRLTLRRPLPSSVWLRDALALPLIFPSMPAVSADAFNARDTKSSAMWWLTQRGPYLAPLADTSASLPLPQVGPQVELRIVLLPFGGRDAFRFKSMGWDTVLATPLQAYTMLLIVQGIDGLQHALALDETVVPPGTKRGRGLCAHASTAALPETVHQQVQEAFLAGMKVCRRLSKENPLASLTLDPGVESVDYTLLVPSDEAKAVRLAQLSRQMPSKRTARNKVELNELRQWSRQQATTSAYMRSYVDAHAYWLGFASGSSEEFLGESSLKVAGLENVVVGDNSAVTTAQWAGEGQKDTLAAGSRSTTMHVAEKAVAELVGAS